MEEELAKAKEEYNKKVKAQEEALEEERRRAKEELEKQMQEQIND